jgi:hypothetical protein
LEKFPVRREEKKRISARIDERKARELFRPNAGRASRSPEKEIREQ